MLTRIFINMLALFSLANLIACSFASPAPTPNAAEIEKEEQAVYSFFVSENRGLVLILQDTSVGVSDNDPQHAVDFIKSGFKDVSAETAACFKERNQQTTQLAPDMQLSVEYALLSADELKQITSQPNWSDVLNGKYPDSNGYTIFSRVGFNDTLDQAVIYVGSISGSMMGEGFYYLMKKQNGEWKIKEQMMVWIS
jgi:hypothetical protein